MAEGKKGSTNEIPEEEYDTIVFEAGGSLVVDMSKVEEAKFENIPKGIYSAAIEQVDFGMSANSGAPMLTLTYKIDEGTYEGRKLLTYASFSRKALPFTKATLLRIDPELFAGQFDPQELAAQGTLLGKKGRISVVLEDYQGEPRSRIASVLAPKAEGSAGESFFNK